MPRPSGQNTERRRPNSPEQTNSTEIINPLTGKPFSEKDLGIVPAHEGIESDTSDVKIHLDTAVNLPSGTLPEDLKGARKGAGGLYVFDKREITQDISDAPENLRGAETELSEEPYFDFPKRLVMAVREKHQDLRQNLITRNADQWHVYLKTMMKSAEVDTGAVEYLSTLSGDEVSMAALAKRVETDADSAKTHNYDNLALLMAPDIFREYSKGQQEHFLQMILRLVEATASIESIEAPHVLLRLAEIANETSHESVRSYIYLIFELFPDASLPTEALKGLLTTISTHQEYNAPIASRFLLTETPSEDPEIRAFQERYETFRDEVLEELSQDQEAYLSMRPAEWSALVKKVLKLNTLFTNEDQTSDATPLNFGIELELAPFDGDEFSAAERVQYDLILANEEYSNLFDASEDQDTAEIRTVGPQPFTKSRMGTLRAFLRQAEHEVHGWVSTFHLHIDDIKDDSMEDMTISPLFFEFHRQANRKQTYELRSFQAPTVPIAGTHERQISATDVIGLEQAIRFGTSLNESPPDIFNETKTAKNADVFPEQDLYRYAVATRLFSQDPKQRAAIIYLTYSGKLFQNEELLSNILHGYKEHPAFGTLLRGFVDSGIPSLKRRLMLGYFLDIEHEEVKNLLLQKIETLYEAIQRKNESPHTSMQQLKEVWDRNSREDDRVNLLKKMAEENFSESMAFIEKRWNTLTTLEKSDLPYQLVRLSSDTDRHLTIPFIQKHWSDIARDPYSYQATLRTISQNGTRECVDFVKSLLPLEDYDLYEDILSNLAKSGTIEALTFVKEAETQNLGWKEYMRLTIAISLAQNGSPAAIALLQEWWNSDKIADSSKPEIISKVGSSGSAAAIELYLENQIEGFSKVYLLKSLAKSGTIEALAFIKAEWKTDIKEIDRTTILQYLSETNSAEAITFIYENWSALKESAFKAYILYSVAKSGKPEAINLIKSKWDNLSNPIRKRIISLLAQSQSHDSLKYIMSMWNENEFPYGSKGTILLSLLNSKEKNAQNFAKEKLREDLDQHSLFSVWTHFIEQAKLHR